MSARIDSTILHEIARVVEARSRVPGKIRAHGKPYQITYLDDHRERLEEAIKRQDADRLGMLFGQLPSKVKYQLLRLSTGRRKVSKLSAGQKRSAKARTRRKPPNSPTSRKKTGKTGKKVSAGRRPRTEARRTRATRRRAARS